MNNLKRFNDKYEREINNFWEQHSKIENRIKKLKEKRDGLRVPMVEDLIKPLADKITQKLGAKGYVVYGPFGICSETGIYWVKDMEKSITYKNNVLGSLTLERSGDGWAIRDLTRQTEDFAEGTIGAFNGMNHPKIEIDDSMNLKWLVQYVKKSK